MNKKRNKKNVWFLYSGGTETCNSLFYAQKTKIDVKTDVPIIGQDLTEIFYIRIYILYILDN